MKIKTKYYYAEKGVYQGSGHPMVLKNRQIISLGNPSSKEDQQRPFYYDDTNYAITYDGNERKQKVVINRLITEADYTTKQQEYLARLSWIQRQKLQWMFRRHWLQEPGIMFHLFIVSLMLTLAFVSYEIMNHRF